MRYSHFQYPISRIEPCHIRQAIADSISSTNFQYPISRIEPCHIQLMARDYNRCLSQLSVSYITDRTLPPHLWKLEKPPISTISPPFSRSIPGKTSCTSFGKMLNYPCLFRKLIFAPKRAGFAKPFFLKFSLILLVCFICLVSFRLLVSSEKGLLRKLRLKLTSDGTPARGNISPDIVVPDPGQSPRVPSSSARLSLQ